jgi:Amt family ammonium transporter
MIRRKNALSMMMQTLTGMAIGSMLWFIVGFALVFGETFHGIIGNPFGKYGFFFHNVSPLESLPAEITIANTIPGSLFASFQMMFALMTPVIVTGAWAEKMQFPAFLWFVSLWPFLVYYPVAHWCWHSTGLMASRGFLDFAGGSVIHVTSGARPTL